MRSRAAKKFRHSAACPLVCRGELLQTPSGRWGQRLPREFPPDNTRLLPEFLQVERQSVLPLAEHERRLAKQPWHSADQREDSPGRRNSESRRLGCDRDGTAGRAGIARVRRWHCHGRRMQWQRGRLQSRPCAPVATCRPSTPKSDRLVHDRWERDQAAVLGR